MGDIEIIRLTECEHCRGLFTRDDLRERVHPDPADCITRLIADRDAALYALDDLRLLIAHYEERDVTEAVWTVMSRVAQWGLRPNGEYPTRAEGMPPPKRSPD